MAKKKKSGSSTRTRDSGTGRFVPPEETKRRPKETEAERIKPPKKK